MPSAARKSLIGGYTSWSDPRTLKPFRLSIAASVAIAVPQMPMRWMWPLLNGGLLDDYTRALTGDHAARHAERQRQGGTRCVTGGKPDDDRAGKDAKKL